MTLLLRFINFDDVKMYFLSSEFIIFFCTVQNIALSIYLNVKILKKVNGFAIFRLIEIVNIKGNSKF